MKHFLTTLVLAVAFHLLIWQSGMGLNMLLFTGLVASATYWLKPTAWQRREVRLLFGSWGFSALCVVWHHSILSMVVYWLVAVLLLGYLQDIRVRFWLFGLLESARALFAGWFIHLRKWVGQSNATPQWTTYWRWLRLAVIPVMLLLVFYTIYSQANTQLAQFNTRLEDWLDDLLTINFAFDRFMVFLLGWGLVLAFLGLRRGLGLLHGWAAEWQFDLMRRSRRREIFPPSTVGLKQEYQTALLTFGVLNVLLLVINSLDLIYVWFSARPQTASELSRYVHEGTWLLIFSIVLAMLVVVGFLRGNLNFFPNNTRLRQLVYLWLGQNAFLALSVGVRNGHYISQYALAHGRVVVLIFLVLVLFGLYTMYRKVQGPKTTFYLLQTNAMAMLTVLLLAAAVNWDSTITRYNLQRAEPDTYYTVYGLDNNLVPLAAAREQGIITGSELYSLNGRIKYIEDGLADWRQWNFSDYRQLRAWQ